MRNFPIFLFASYFVMISLVPIQAKFAKDEVEKEFLLAMKNCNGSEHLSKDKSRWLLNAHMDEEAITMTEICLLSCTLQKMDLIDMNLKIQQKHIMTFARKIEKHPGSSEILGQELLSCERDPDIYEEPSCIVGYITYDCLREVLRKYWKRT